MDTILSIVVLAAIALVAGAVYLWRIGRRQQAGLMLVLALVMVINVLMWTVPDSSGSAPLDRIETATG